jgi:ATP-dependent protease ClpP protease subunit
MKIVIFFLLALGIIANNNNNTNNNNIIQLKEGNFVHIHGQINDYSSQQFINNILKISSDKIYVYIFSPGGSVYNGNEIIQILTALKFSGKDIHCIGDFAASMAFVILQSCTHRHVMPTSIIMQHQMTLGIDGKLEEILNYLDMVVHMKEDTDDFQSNRLGITNTEFNNKISNDWWMYGKTIINNNAADDIVNVLCDSALVSHNVNQTINTIFGNVIVEFSKCPLIKKPFNIYFDEDLDNNNKTDAMDYINNEYINPMSKFKTF